MAFFELTYKGRQRVKTLLIVVCIIAVSLMGVHIWFINNARGILKSIVEEKSGGLVRVELRKVAFNFFSKQLQVHEGSLVSTDTISTSTVYKVGFSKLTLKVRSFWPLLLNKRLNLDSINILNPVIEVVQLRSDTTSQTNSDEISVTQEMGKIYNSLIDVLQDFGIRRILVSNASLKLANKTEPLTYPVWITNINLDVVRRPENRNHIAADEKVSLTTTNQSIALPGGRHHLSFKNFSLQLFQKRIQLDSCTITAIANGPTKSSYKIFFNKLMLVGADFAAMSNQNIVRADSVYCENPFFDLNINPVRDPGQNTERTSPEKIIRELTSDLDLAYIGVKDAGISINIQGPRPRTISNSNKDNFEIRGLRIHGDSTIPVSVQRFDMLVRDYQLYNVDSSAIFGFDSIHFINSKIILNNFTVLTTPSKLKLKSIRDFRFPKFELSGLDWYQLIFDQNLVAREAVLTNPDIRYTRKIASNEKAGNFFETLQTMDSLMTLEQLKIVNGMVNLNFGRATTLHLEHVNLMVSSNKLLKATNQDGLRKAVDYFSLTRGVLTRKDLTARLMNMRYEANNTIYADQLLITSASNKVDAVVNKVAINNMLLNDQSDMITADGLRWNNATVTLQTIAGKAKRSGELDGMLDVKNIAGTNTRLVLNNGITNINSSVDRLQVNALVKLDDGSVNVQGVKFGGNRLDIDNGRKKIRATMASIEVDAMLLQREASNIQADGVRWDGASLVIHSLKAADTTSQNEGMLAVSRLMGTNTSVQLVNSGGGMSGLLSTIAAASIRVNGSRPAKADGLLVQGSNITYTNDDITAQTSDFQVAQDNNSFINGLSLTQVKQGDSTDIQIPAIQFATDINSLLAGTYKLQQLNITRPVININHSESNNQTNTADTNRIPVSIDRLTITQPHINFGQTNKKSLTRLQLQPGDSSKIVADSIVMKKGALSISSLVVNTNTATLDQTGKQSFGVHNGDVNLNLRNIEVGSQKGKSVWQVLVNKMNVRNADTIFVGKKNNKLVLDEVSFGNILLSSGQGNNTLTTNNTQAWLHTTGGQLLDSVKHMRWYNGRYNNQSQTFELDSLVYQPAQSRSATIAKAPYQFDFITLKTGSIQLTGFNLDQLQRDTFVAKTMTITKPVITVYRDKNAPEAPRYKRPFPAEAINAVASPLNLDTVKIIDGRVSYTEETETHRNRGTIEFTGINGNIANIQNGVHTKHDSLRVDIQAQLMNEALLHLKVDESYTDTMHGFRMNLTLQPFKMSLLNPVMVPLSNIQIRSGFVDSFALAAIANNTTAVGKVNLFYHGLRIGMVKDGNINRTGFRRELISFFANTFVIKNRNTKNKGLIYLERIREKSIFQYLLRISLNGMGSSIGMINNSKQLKKILAAEKDSTIPEHAKSLLLGTSNP